MGYSSRMQDSPLPRTSLRGRPAGPNRNRGEQEEDGGNRNRVSTLLEDAPRHHRRPPNPDLALAPEAGLLHSEAGPSGYGP